MKIIAGARSSPLSKVQFEEVRDLLCSHHPDVVLAPTFVSTIGDRDKETSLRTMGQTDFFTREIDQLLLDGVCRIGIHSAKDLPDPLHDGLVIVAITQGIDPSDSLVLREGESLETLFSGARIATSSIRREEAVTALRSDLTFVDIRGTIAERIGKLEQKEVDGVVVAEAALIRLRLTHLNRIRIPGITTPMQGRLAVVAREGDECIQELFTCIDSR